MLLVAACMPRTGWWIKDSEYVACACLRARVADWVAYTAHHQLFPYQARHRAPHRVSPRRSERPAAFIAFYLISPLVLSLRCVSTALVDCAPCRLLNAITSHASDAILFCSRVRGPLIIVVLSFSASLTPFSFPSMGKPSGIRAARHLHVRRRSQKWADKQYNKVHLGSVFKSNPFGGASHAKGIVVEKVFVVSAIFPPLSRHSHHPSSNSGVESKQPNSAIRKCVR